ncbi:MAG: sigma-70 family RNA polymerase sigma factor [Pseudomonadota bacterium]
MTDIHSTIERYLPDARGGDSQAFSELVKSTQTTVASIALAIVRDVQVSEDIAQEAYLRIWHRLGDLRNPGSFLPWLRQVTRNLARDHLRRAKARPGDRVSGDASEALAELLDGRPNAEAQLLVDEDLRALEQALEELPTDAREILTLYYREDRSVDQLSALLGISAAGVRQRLSRARQRLREGVEPLLESTLIRSSPGTAFTAAVGSLLAASAPPPAAAAAATAATMGTKSVLKAAALGGLGLLLGALGGIAGVLLGMRPLLKTPFSDEEHAALLRQQRLGVGIVLLAVLGFAAVMVLPGWLPAVAVYLAFILALTWHTQLAVPRILEERLAAEREDDPEAGLRQARARKLGLLGLIGGGLSGFLGLAAGLVTSGRLG